MEHRKQLAKELQKLLRDGHEKKLKIMVLGDFNENMDTFLEKRANGLSTNTHPFKFLNLLQHYRLFNVVEHHSSLPYATTWKNATRQSRIDGIYLSDSLLNESISAFTDDILRPNITDHSCVISKFNRGLFFKLDKFFDRQNKPRTCHFEFHKMDL